MFCPRCGQQASDSSQFCSKCGAAVELLSLNPPNRRQPKRLQLGPWIFLAVSVAGGVWLAGFIRSHIAHSAPLPVSREVVRAPHRESILNSSIRVGAGSSSYYKLVVPENATQAYVDGDFSTAGGFGSAVQVLVVDRDSFAKFRNGTAPDTLYNSGMASQSSIHALLPGPGTYYLVCSNPNRVSPGAPTSIEVNAVLHYMN